MSITFEGWDLFWLAIYFALATPAMFRYAPDLGAVVSVCVDRLINRWTRRRGPPPDPRWASPEHFNCRSSAIPFERGYRVQAVLDESNKNTICAEAHGLHVDRDYELDHGTDCRCVVVSKAEWDRVRAQSLGPLTAPKARH